MVGFQCTREAHTEQIAEERISPRIEMHVSLSGSKELYVF
jgi:hypothetical protein